MGLQVGQSIKGGDSIITFQISGDSPEEIKAFLQSIYKQSEEPLGPKILPKERITKEEKALIIKLDKEGKTCEEIKAITGIKNYRQITGIIQANKYPLERRLPRGKQAEINYPEIPDSSKSEDSLLGPIDQTGRTPDGAMPNTHHEPSGSTIEPSSSRPATEDSPVSTAPSRKQDGPKIPHSVDAFIQEGHDKGGKKFGEIAAILTQKGIPCNKNDVSNRYYSLQVVKAAESSAILKEYNPADSEPTSLTDDQKARIRRLRNQPGGAQLRNMAIARRLDLPPKLVDSFVIAEEREQAKADQLKNNPKAYAEFMQRCKQGTPEADLEDKEDDRSWEAVEQ